MTEDDAVRALTVKGFAECSRTDAIAAHYGDRRPSREVYRCAVIYRWRMNDQWEWIVDAGDGRPVGSTTALMWPWEVELFWVDSSPLDHVRYFRRRVGGPK